MEDLSFKTEPLLSNVQITILVVFCVVMLTVLLVVKRQDILKRTKQGNQLLAFQVTSQRISQKSIIYTIEKDNCQTFVLESEHGVIELNFKEKEELI